MARGPTLSTRRAGYGASTTRLTRGMVRATFGLAMTALVRTLIAVVVLILCTGTAEAKGVRLLAYGDSLIQGYGLPTRDTFPKQLERALKERGYDVTVINGGRSGDTSAAGLARLDWALAEKPDAVILELGSNDALRGLPPEDMEANLSAILEKLADRYIPVLLAGMIAPHNLGEDYVRAYDAVFPALVDRFDVVYYPFFLAGVVLHPDLNQADGIHPNAKGVAVIVERILPSVIELIEDHEELRDKAGRP
jgi:acyl-CoA thioesterase-1